MSSETDSAKVQEVVNNLNNLKVDKLQEVANTVVQTSDVKTDTTKLKEQIDQLTKSVNKLKDEVEQRKNGKYSSFADVASDHWANDYKNYLLNT